MKPRMESSRLRSERLRLSQVGPQVLASIAARRFRHFFRRALRDHLASTTAALGTKIDDVIRHLDDIQIVLNDDDGIARIRQLLQYVDQLLYVDGVQAGRGFVQDVERPPGGALG